MPPKVIGQVYVDRPSNPLLEQTAMLTALASSPAPLNSGVPHQVAALAARVANQFRDVRFREAVGSSTNVISACYAFLTRMYSTQTMDHTVKAVTTEQLMFVLANIVLVHDDNYNKSLEAGAAPMMTKILKAMLKAAIQKSEFNGRAGACLRALLSAIYNLCAGCVPARKALLEADILVPLTDLIEATYASRLSFCLAALRQIQVFCTIEDAFVRFPQSLLVSLSKSIVTNGSFQDDRDKALDETRFEVVKMSVNLIAGVMLQHPAPHTSWPFAPFPSSASKKSPKSKPMWDRLLFFIREASPPNKRKVGDVEKGSEKEWIDLKQNLGVALATALTLYDPSDPGKDPKDPVLETLVGWMTDKEFVENQPALLTQVGIMLGNLAGNEYSCRILVEKLNILEPLAAVFRVWAVGSSAQASPDLPNQASQIEQMEVLQSMYSVAQNLAVLEINRPKIASSGIMTSALECLKPSFDQVTPLEASPMGSAIRLLQMLCQSNPPNVDRLLEVCKAQPILDLICRIEHSSVKIEACRLLGYVVIAAGPDDAANGINLLRSDLVVDTLVCFQHLAANAQRRVLMDEAHRALARMSPSLAPAVLKSLIKHREAGTPAVSGPPTYLCKGLARMEIRDPGSRAEAFKKAREAASRPIESTLQTPVNGSFKTGLEVLVGSWALYLGDYNEKTLPSAEIRKNAVVVLKSLAEQFKNSKEIATEDKEAIELVVKSLLEVVGEMPPGLMVQPDICDVVDVWKALLFQT